MLVPVIAMTMHPVSYTHLDVYKRQEEASELLSENKALRRHLEEALLRLEGYEIMGDILQEDTVSTC